MRLSRIILFCVIMCLAIAGWLRFGALSGQAKEVQSQAVQASQEVTVTATVMPHRVVVVNAAGTIVQIVSNGPQDVEPEYRRGSLTGPRLADCVQCVGSYERLKQGLDFSVPGTVYSIR